MKVELYKKFKCEKLIEELDNLVNEASNLFEDVQTCRVSGPNILKLERFELILLDHFLNKTNFEKVFDEILLSYGDLKDFFHTIIHNLLCELHKKILHPTFSDLLDKINSHITQKQALPIKKYSYYIPIRVEHRDLTNKEFKTLNKKLKKTFNFSFQKTPKYIFKQIESKKFKGLFSSRKVLKIEATARDHVYPISKMVDKNLSGFLGVLSFSNHFRSFSKKWSISPGRAIQNSPLEDYLIIVENKNIIYPARWTNYSFIDTSMIGKNIWNIHNKPRGNYRLLIRGLDLISKSCDKLKPLIFDSLSLYFEAIIENQVELSFLKFWIVGENIAKQAGKLTDDTLKSIFKKFTKDRYSKKMIDSLHKKRNKLVHEFKINLITQNDRNFIKLISESLILALIDPPTKINNVKELRIMLDNFNLDKNTLKAKRRIINKFIKL